MNETVAVEHKLDWDQFVSTWWDRAPVLFRGMSPTPFVESEVFQAAVTAGTFDQCLTTPLASVVVDGAKESLPGPLLPASDDNGFNGYEDRIAQILGSGTSYALTITWLHCLDQALWTRERDFLAPLWQQVGLPVTGAITTLFHGPYTSTPIGVHKDRFATCMLGLRGRKRMRFWSARPWSSDVSSVQDYRDYLEKSFTADVGPGEFLYWPAEYFHVGEGLDDVPATSVNIGLPRTEHTAGYEVQDLLTNTPFRTLIDSQADPATGYPPVNAPLRSSGPDSTGLLASGLPKSFHEAAKLLSSEGLVEHARAVSQRRWSAGGLQPTPAESTLP